MNWYFLVEENMGNVTFLYFLSKKKETKTKFKTTLKYDKPYSVFNCTIIEEFLF